MGNTNGHHTLTQGNSSLLSSKAWVTGLHWCPGVGARGWHPLAVTAPHAAGGSSCHRDRCRRTHRGRRGRVIQPTHHPPETSASAKACPSASGWTGPSVATPRPSGTGWGGEWIRMPRGLLALAWEGAVSPALLTRGWGVGESGRPELLELCCLETELGWPGCN